MHFQEAIPKDAAAVILLREAEEGGVYLAQRNPAMAFLGGYYAFPGGKTDAADAEVEVRNCADGELRKFIVCAARETFEETGVLLARGGDRITKGQRASLRDDLVSGRFSFAEILETWGLWLDGADFEYAGFWTTPKFSPVRFKTRFFLAVCPRRQQPETFGEFVGGDFAAPAEALRRWENSEILISPPVLVTLQILADGGRGGEAEDGGAGDPVFSPSRPSPFPASRTRKNAVEKLLAASRETGGEIRYIRLNPFITVFPVRTETLPPATHTNCFIAGGDAEFIVIDPGSPFVEEQRALARYLDSLVERGGVCRGIVLSHLHRDHVSGVHSLQKHFHEKHGSFIKVAAHRATAESLKDSLGVDNFLEDGEIISLRQPGGGGGGENFELTVLHTPGHARGHLCFYDARRGFLLSGDNVLGAGSVLVRLPEGDMSGYLASLERMKDLPGLRFLCGSHGAAVFDARGKIEEYIRHRLSRERQILEAVRSGAKTVEEIVRRVYPDLEAPLSPLAAESVSAHLVKLTRDGFLTPPDSAPGGH